MSGNIPSDAGAERRTFQIHSCLGRGGFGEVYRATMSSSGGVETEVAIKVLRADINPGSDSVKRLRDEGRLLGKLSHPAIVKVHDLVVLDARVSLVTEYIEGEDLDQAWAGRDRMSARALIMAIGEVASALAAAWDSPSPISGEPLHLVHRDVKPANIRIGKHGEVKLLDFGIARAGNAVREAQTAANAMMGSYLYMAPERFHEDLVEPPSDVFALGSVTYEGLAGERFFGGMTLQQVYAFMLSTNRLARRLDERLAELAADCPEPVLALIREMMDPEPSKRPTARQVAQRCEDLAENLPGASLKKWCRQHAWSEPGDIQGSLDGRTLTAGTVGTHDPAPWRTENAPVMTSGRIPNAPPAPTGSASDYTPPPQAAPPPKPQALGGGPAGSVPAASGRQSGPSLPTQPGVALGGASMGGPSLGDLSLARSDAGRDEPAFVFGGADPDAETEEQPREWEEEIARHQRRRGVWGLILGVGVVAVVVVGVIAVAGVVVMNDPSLIGVGEAAPILDVPLEEGNGSADDGGEPADEDPEDGVGDGDEADGQQDGGEETPEPAPEPAPAEPAPAEPEPAPAPSGPTAASLTKKGWSSMGDPGAALELFKQALDLNGDYADAHYGAGYALMELGRNDEAKVSLCRGKALADSRTANEIDRILETHGLSCD